MRDPPLVLVDDDAEHIRTLCQHVLLSHQILTIEAANGHEAIEQYRLYQPDAVILDISMPGGDGLAALREIKRLDASARVLMLTARAQRATVLEALRYGAKDFVVKPFERKRLLEGIERLLGRGQQG